MSSKIYYLYQITNWYNGKIYIGVHSTTDVDDGYLGSGKLLRRAINIYGAEYFTKDVLEFFETKEEMYQCEKEIVDEDFVKRKDTYNIKIGGEGGFDYINNNMTPFLRLNPNIARERIVKYNSNPKTIKELRKRLQTDEIRSKISKGLKEYYKTHAAMFKGKKHTEESKRKISEANSIHQKGSGNSQYGTCWIYNLELKESKKISKDDLGQWLENGWSKGRKIKF